MTPKTLENTLLIYYCWTSLSLRSVRFDAIQPKMKMWFISYCVQCRAEMNQTILMGAGAVTSLSFKR